MDYHPLLHCVFDSCVRIHSIITIHWQNINTHISSVFEIAIIIFQFLQYSANHSATRLTPTSASDLPAILTEIAQFVPGVTPPLVAFLIWGTTETYWQEIKSLFSCYISRRRSSPSVVSRKDARSLNFERLSNKSNQKVFAATTELRDMVNIERSRGEQRC